jgi:hypothetical protein
MAIAFRSEPCVPVEEMRRNAEHTKTLGLPSVEYAGNVAVVGGGPSLADHLDELRAWNGPIWAINATWAWLKERGVKATFFTVDPKPQSWLKLSPGESAIVASVGSAELFQSLSGGYVRTFNLGLHEVHSGVTSATAAPHLAVQMGHRSVSFFGCDSSFEGLVTHVYPGDPPPDLILIRVGEEVFFTKPEFVMQAEDLAALCRELPGFHKNRSGGLLAALVANPEAEVIACAASMLESAA